MEGVGKNFDEECNPAKFQVPELKKTLLAREVSTEVWVQIFQRVMVEVDELSELAGKECIRTKMIAMGGA